MAEGYGTVGEGLALRGNDYEYHNYVYMRTLCFRTFPELFYVYIHKIIPERSGSDLSGT